MARAPTAFRRTVFGEAPRTSSRGDALPWIELFLDAVLVATGLASVNALQVVDLVCDNPIVTTRLVEGRLGVARPTALRLLRRLEGIGLLEEAPQEARGQRRYVARELLDVLAADVSRGETRRP